jgi:hypothetical protein
MQYMKAALLAQSKEVGDDGSIVEIIIWELPEPLPPSEHRYKYRLFYGWPGREVVRYDNERGKGDHRLTERNCRTSSSRSSSCSTTSNSTCASEVHHEGDR